MELKIYQDKVEVAQEFSKYFAEQTKGNEPFHVALSGGSTPKIVFDVLAEKFGASIDWKLVHFYWGDERCVLPTDDESNYKMTVEHLLSKIDIPEGNIHRVEGENDPEKEAERYAQVLKNELPAKNGFPQFDLVILGMGDDGHTASIFPHEIELWDSENLCAVAVHPDSGQKRVTITGNVINHSKTVAFLVTGASKEEKVGEIINKEGSYTAYPANLVAPTTGDLLWFLDKAAAAKITEGQV
ncbi:MULTISPECIES: 6-phosphogluconolactonase [unclassified Zobellia]|uniref:6-phosphogluconolactonase n=1 Tax=unclassified Zobellia TaxID=2620635 RepID=UPI001C0794E9|nr:MULTISPECIES: 6-phosphogluconolactonase [unclassified Zobellia]MBU2976339.1 6-phosphogluconolactonase [Zobellia sp. B3R18]MDO6819333.1 6-phosphogluconolactonase [Zobellia sp. 1_MG-2023]